MKINGPHLDKVQKLYQQQKDKLKNQQEKKADKMDISGQAQDIKNLQKEIKNMPGIREKKVARLKDKIEKGEYRIDSRLLAKKLLNQPEQE
ncbi:MAG: flagellar biosynthesis anti-sigma factor FlgM [Bacillota bacterium]